MSTMEGVASEYDNTKEASDHSNARTGLGRKAVAWLKEAARSKREVIDPRLVLLDQPIQNEQRMAVIHREAQRSNMLNLRNVQKGEYVFVRLLRYGGEDGRMYGHARELVLQRYDEDGEAPLFKVTGDEYKIYEKTNPSMQPFRDFDAVRISAARPNPLSGETEFAPYLDYGQPFSFRRIGGEVEQSDYRVAQISVGYENQIYDLLTEPARKEEIFRA